jgi:hypothetical protein
MKFVQDFGRKVFWNRTLERLKIRSQDDINMDLTKIDHEDGSYPIAGFCISGAKPLGPATRVLIIS